MSVPAKKQRTDETWLALVDEYYDDCKRPRWEMHVVGAYDTRREAAVAAVSDAFARNAEAQDDFADGCPEQLEYARVARSVLGVDLDDDAAYATFVHDHLRALEACLGGSDSHFRPHWETVERPDADAQARAVWAKYEEVESSA